MHWDFALILAFLAGAAPLLGRRRIRRIFRASSTTKAERLSLYASTLLFQWLAAGLIFWRTTARGIPLASLGLALPSPALTAVVAVALAAFILVNQFFSLKRLTTQPLDSQNLLLQLALKVFPQDAVERLVFFALVVSVALCEEFIYRGFVQHVFETWPRPSVTAGIIVSALLFGAAHLYQGRRGLAATFAAGLIFSIVRAVTGSLLAPMLCHFVADITAGFLAPTRVREALGRAQRRTEPLAPPR